MKRPQKDKQNGENSVSLIHENPMGPGSRSVSGPSERLADWVTDVTPWGEKDNNASGGRGEEA